jgi:hypothetical protein
VVALRATLGVDTSMASQRVTSETSLAEAYKRACLKNPKEMTLKKVIRSCQKQQNVFIKLDYFYQ